MKLHARVVAKSLVAEVQDERGGLGQKNPKKGKVLT